MRIESQTLSASWLQSQGNKDAVARARFCPPPEINFRTPPPTLTEAALSFSIFLNHLLSVDRVF